MGTQDEDSSPGLGTVFNCLSNSQTAFQTSGTVSHSHQQCMRVPVSHILSQNSLLSVFVFSQPSGWGVCEVASHVVLICISLMANDIEHLFMCLLAICLSCLERHLFRS